MVHPKNKNAKSSSRIHTSRTRVKVSGRSKSQSFVRKSFLYGRRAIMSVIVLVCLAVILMVLFGKFATPENIVTNKITSITKDYYENYFYDTIIGTNSIGDDSEKSLEQIMSRYIEPGFASISLRQLLLFGGQRHADAAPILQNYCDENRTNVKIYPEPPFGRTDYHVEYNYSCEY